MLIKTIVIFLVLLTFALSAQTIRPNHWLDDELRYYWFRGQLWNLSPVQRPYTAHEIVAAMDTLPGISGDPALTLLKKMPSSARPETALAWVQLDNAFVDAPESEPLQSVQRATLGAQLLPRASFYTTFYIDNQLDADSAYVGKRQSGLGAYMEQAYLLFDFKKFRAKFGRDFLVWGPGLDAALHLSDASRPMDHLYLFWANRWISLSYFTGSLDRTEYPIKNEASVQNRYISGHRIEMRPWRFLRLGLSETALFGGPHAGLDFALINPVIFYTGVQANGPQTANVLGSLDAVYMPVQNVSVYGSFLLDDIQIENETKDDQEPASIGFLAGLNWADPFDLSGLDLFGEYTRVTNRTYNGQGGMWEKYLHRDVPIGHFLGNDFDRVLAGFRYRPMPTLRFSLIYESRRRGEGRVQDPFTTPWRNIMDGEKYREPFPTGIVESGTNLRLMIRWQPKLWIYSNLQVSYWKIDNVNHQFGKKNDDLEIRLSLTCEFIKTVWLD